MDRKCMTDTPLCMDRNYELNLICTVPGSTNTVFGGNCDFATTLRGSSKLTDV
jgi:hypothetical protein